MTVLPAWPTGDGLILVRGPSPPIMHYMGVCGCFSGEGVHHKIRPSPYLLDTAKRYIEGDITMDEVKGFIDTYYKSRESR